MLCIFFQAPYANLRPEFLGWKKVTTPTNQLQNMDVPASYDAVSGFGEYDN